MGWIVPQVALCRSSVTPGMCIEWYLVTVVPVGGRNFFRLLQGGEAALLYPGGVREVLHFHPADVARSTVGVSCHLSKFIF